MPTPLSEDERESIKKLLTEAHGRAEAGEYDAATDSVRQARERDPENIYILAFEKQVEQLSLLASSNSLTEESLADILDSLGGIIDRAVAVVSEGGTAATAAPVAPAAATPEDRAAAMEWLKSQYFQQAHQYVRKGEYDHALAEIRRVFIIEPVNETARQFESHILELKELHRLVPEAAAPQAPPAPKAPAPRPRTPAQPSPAQSSPNAAEETHGAKRRSGTLIIGIIAIAMAFIGFALIYNWVRSTEAKQEPPPVVIPQPEVFFADPVTVPDTARTPGSREVAPESVSSRTGVDTTATSTRPERGRVPEGAPPRHP
jgi:tetratricopeptide (TPR) repeat protein